MGNPACNVGIIPQRCGCVGPSLRPIPIPCACFVEHRGLIRRLPVIARCTAGREARNYFADIATRQDIRNAPCLPTAGGTAHIARAFPERGNCSPSDATVPRPG